MDMDSLEQIIDNAVSRHGLRIVYDIFTSYDLIPYLTDPDGNNWTEANLAGYVDGEPFETCLAYLAGDAKRSDLPHYEQVNSALAQLRFTGNGPVPLIVNRALGAIVLRWRSGSPENAGASIAYMLTALDDQAFGRLGGKWLDNAMATISEIIDEADNDQSG